MSDQPDMDFLNVAGEAFAEALWEFPDLGDVLPHDFYEVFLAALGLPLDSARLAALTASDYEKLRRAGCEYFEVEAFPSSTLPLIVAQVLKRWPAE